MKLAILLVLGWVACSESEIKNLEKLAEDSCSPSDVSEFLEISESERLNFRTKSDKFGVDFAVFAKAVRTRDFSPVAKEALPGIVLLSILCFFSLLGILFSLLFCFVCDDSDKTSESKAVGFAFCGSLFAIAALGFILAVLVFSGRAVHESKKSDCFVNSLTRDLIDGYKAEGESFVGFGTLKSILDSVNGSLGLLRGFSLEMADIANGEFDSLFQTSLQTLPSFQSRFSPSKTSNGKGEKTTPLSIEQMDVGIYPPIRSEFESMYNISSTLKGAAREGQTFANPSTMITMSQQLSQSSQEVDKIVTNVTDALTSVEEVKDFIKRTSRWSGIIMIIVSLLLLAVSVITLIQLWRMTRGKDKSLRNFIKSLLVWLSVLTFIASAMTLVFYASAVALGSSCSGLSLMLNSTDINQLFTSWQIDTGSSSRVMDVCVSSGKSGKVLDVFESPQTVSNLKQISTFADGFYEIKKIMPRVSEGKLDSIEIARSVENWQEISQGLSIDQPPVTGALGTLNSQCSSTYFRLNSVNCSSSLPECLSLFNTTSFPSGKCSVDSEQIFNNLKEYQSDEVSLMTDLIESIQGGLTTPNGKFRFAFSSLADRGPSIENIRTALNETLVTIDGKGGNISSQLGCRIIKNDLLVLEAGLCDQYHTSLVFGMIFTVVASICLLIFTFSAYCSLVYQPEFEARVEFVEKTDVSAIEPNAKQDSEINPFSHSQRNDSFNLYRYVNS